MAALDTTGKSSPLSAICALARLSLGAASVSIALVHDDGLRYVAADGAGAAGIVGTHLPAGTGIAGIVAATGQSISVRDPVSDPRFAREVGERTGYIPNAIRCVAVLDPNGDVAAVLSILDQGTHPLAPSGAGVEGAVVDGGAHDGGAKSVGVTGVLELVLDLAAALVPAGDDDGADLDGRLAELPARDRDRAIAVVTAVLDAFES